MRAIMPIVMRHARIDQCSLPIAAFCVLLLTLSSPDVSNFAIAQDLSANAPAWRADHHMHLASPELCRLVGECLDSNHPPAVFASDAVRALDEAHVSKGVILSCAYLLSLIHI